MTQEQDAELREEAQPLVVAGDQSKDRERGALDIENPSGQHLQRRLAESVPPALANLNVAVAAGTNRDRPWGYAFMVIVAMTILSVVLFGSNFFGSLDKNLTSWSQPAPDQQQQGNAGDVAEPSVGWLGAGFISVVMLPIAGGLAVSCVHSLINCQRTILWAASLGFILVFLVLVAIMESMVASFGSVGRKVPWGAWADLIAYLVIYVVFIHTIPRLLFGTERLDFATANLKVSTIESWKQQQRPSSNSLGEISSVKQSWYLEKLLSLLGEYWSRKPVPPA